MQLLDQGMEPFVLRLLPVLGSRIAEEYTAAEWSNGVNAAQTVHLEDASGGHLPEDRQFAQGRGVLGRLGWLQTVGKGRQFGSGDVEAMPVFLESATPPRCPANRLAIVDFLLKLVVYP